MISPLAGERRLADIRSNGTKPWAQRRDVARRLFLGVLGSCEGGSLGSHRLTLLTFAIRVARLWTSVSWLHKRVFGLLDDLGLCGHGGRLLAENGLKADNLNNSNNSVCRQRAKYAAERTLII